MKAAKRMRSWFHEKTQERKRKQYEYIVSEAARIVLVSRRENNTGLLKKYLKSMRGVTRISYEYGGFRPAFVDVFMSDGYEVHANDLFFSDALRKAILRTARRIRDKYRNA